MPPLTPNMIIQVNPNSYECACEISNIGVNRIAVGFENLSTRTSCVLDKKQLVHLIKLARKTNIYILTNRFYFEDDINELTKSLLFFNKCKIKGIIFCDYAVVQIIKEQKLKFNLVYDSGNLVTNYGQFNFFLKNNINEIVLSPDLEKEEIDEILLHKKKLNIQLHCAGHAYIFQSKWPLLSTFSKEKRLKKHQPYYLREESRAESLLIYEDNHGTSIWTKYSVNLYSELNKLKHVDTLLINGFLMSTQWTKDMTLLFIKTIKSNIIDNQQNIKIDLDQSIAFYKNKTTNLRLLQKTTEQHE